MFLVDTNVFSETRKRRVDPRVERWFAATPASQIHMSVITDFELERGMLLVQHREPAQATALRRWVDSVRTGLSNPMLEVTPEIARVCAAIQVPHRRPLEDALLAATALHHDLTVVTRNVKDFDVPGLRVIDPFSG